MKHIFLPVCIIASLVLGCVAKPGKPDAGSLEDGAYKNNFFKLTLPIPRRAIAELSPPGADRFLDFYLKLLTAEKTDSQTKMFYLLHLSTLPSPLLGPDDALITVAAASIKDKPGFDRNRARALARMLFENAPIPLLLEQEFHAVQLGGVEFDAAQFKADFGPDHLHEAIYVTLRRDHALIITVISRGEGGLKKADAALAAMRFAQ